MMIEGGLQSPHDSSDLIYEHLALGVNPSSLPSECTWEDYCRPVRDQGKRPCCASFVGTSMREIHAKREDPSFDEDLSPEFLYYHRTNSPSIGFYARDLFQVMKTVGVCAEKDYPYRQDELAPRPSKKIYELAAEYKIDNYARITTKIGLQKAIYELSACYILLPLKSKSRHFWRGSGETTTNHSVCLVGYNKKGFIVKNSWGDRGVKQRKTAHDKLTIDDGIDFSTDSDKVILLYSEFDLILEAWTILSYNLIKDQSKDIESISSSCDNIQLTKQERTTVHDEYIIKKKKKKTCTLF
jgi:hypothetical protein